ncbi:hypothetical protein, partial [Parabacteroides sp.]|uniref:hypothetical protein n=1 Tax=Parabacteroides sp. TaxID=1869337 RepID=UPI00257E2D01
YCFILQNEIKLCNIFFQCIYPPLLGKMFVGATFVIATSPVFASGADLPVVNRPVAVASPRQSKTTITGVI